MSKIAFIGLGNMGGPMAANCQVGGSGHGHRAPQDLDADSRVA